MDKITANRLLSRINFITSLGDFISLFAILQLIYVLSKSVILAAYIIPIKSAAILLYGLIFPFLVSRISLKRILTHSQTLSGFSMGLIALYWTISNSPSPYIILLLAFFQTFFRQCFSGAKDTYSKSMGAYNEHRSFQAQLLFGQYGAQFLGPVLSFILIYYLPLSIPLWIDTCTFFVAALLCIKFPFVSPKYRHSILNPIKYIFKTTGLREIFILRSIGMWIPISIWNYVAFTIITKHYGLELIHSVWIYCIVGAGSFLASYLLNESGKQNILKTTMTKYHDSYLAAFGFLLIGIIRMFFIFPPDIFLAILLTFVGGFCNGLNAITSLSLRRKLTTDQEFPEVIGFEMIVGKACDWIIGTSIFILFSKGIIDYHFSMLICGLSFFVLAIYSLNKNLRV